MSTALMKRLEALEAARSARVRPYDHLSNEELMTRILRLALRKEPDPADVAECMPLPIDELKRRVKELQVKHQVRDGV